VVDEVGKGEGGSVRSVRSAKRVVEASCAS
jgi:hypothetical protein